MIRPVVAQTLDSSSIATMTIRAPVPVPPYCSSKGRPKSSCSRKSSTMSHGNSAFLSISAARGATRSRASVRTRSRISRCSSVSGSYGTQDDSICLGGPSRFPPKLSLHRSVARTGRLTAVVEDGLDVVPIGVEHEGRVVALVILPLARRAVVAIALLDRNSVELLYFGTVSRGERDVDVLAQRLLVLRDREVAPVRRVLLLVRPGRRVAERCEHRLVERHRRGEVGNAEGDVVDHPTREIIGGVRAADA